MTTLLVEAGCAARRLARRRAARGAALIGAGLFTYAALVRPVGTARDAVSAATAIATFTLLVAAAGVIGDDRERGRLAIVATHPVPVRTWVVGRWLALCGVAVAVLVPAAAALLAVAGAWHTAGAVALALAASLAHLAAFAALAVALSCRVGATVQVLTLLAILIAGAVPPDVAAQAVPAAWAGDVARALWAALPTSWALGRLHAWSLSAGAGAPWLALALALQSAVWLAAGERGLGRGDLAPREGGG